MRRADRNRRDRLLPRTTQIILGERESLVNALRLLRSSRLPDRRRRREEKLLGDLVRERTRELNSINPDWDRKVRRASNSRASSAEILRLFRETPPMDYYLLRLISEHPNTPPVVLAKLADHSYSAVRENVARHPHTPVAVLRRLCHRRREPLWYLVAFNPNTPDKLRQQLRARIRQRGEQPL